MPNSHLQPVRLSSGLNILAALWLIMSPYGFGFQMLNPPFWNSVAVGFAVAVLATIRLVLPFTFVEIGWLNFALGAYLALSPFLFGFTDVTAAMWNCVAVGVVFMVMSAWSAVAGKQGARLSGTGSG